MNSCCGNQRSSNLTENSESTDNCNDPIQLLDEFQYLYCEKIKSIEEKCKNPTQEKIKVLEEWVKDLAGQNRVLIDMAKKLECEALARAKQVDELVNDAKENVQQDELESCTSGITNSDLKCKVSELEDLLCKNEQTLKACTADMEELSKTLEVKNKECDSLLGQKYCPGDLQQKIENLETDLQCKIEEIKSLQEQHVGSLKRAECLQKMYEELCNVVTELQIKIGGKEEVITKLKACLETKEVNPTLDSAQCSFMAQLKEKDDEIFNLQMSLDKNTTLLHNQRQKIEKLTKEMCDLERDLKCKEEKFIQKEGELQNEICQLKDEEAKAVLRINKLVNELQNQQSCNDVNPSSHQAYGNQMQCVLEALENKECEINRHLLELEKLKKDNYKIKQIFQQCEKQHRIDIQELNNQLIMKQEELSRMYKERPKVENKSRQGDNNIIILEFKEKQKALAGEVANKYDEIRHLKGDIRDLEEKLHQSEKQTQFRDDLIKQLRKEIKHGRAKESLAEMLGLKGTPRAEMKDRIDNLTGQMEELKAQNLSLDARLAECNLPAVLTLRSRLNQAEGSLLAMCNKIDYVRRYLENLKGDEELSMKCGLEALLTELRDDVEWNRQTRRNLSLDEGTSVIVISNRSRSLPDNSLHRISTKSQSDPVLMSNKTLAVTTQLPKLQETFHECKNYTNTINELENNFDETEKAISSTWNSLKQWSESSGDSIAKFFGVVIRSSAEGNENLRKLATQVGSLLDYKEDDEDRNYTLDFLQKNLLDLGNQLANLNLMAPSDDSLCSTDIAKSDEFGAISKKVTLLINDSVSLLTDMKNKRSNSITSITYFKSCLEEIMALFASIIGHYKTDLEKLVSLQKQQTQFVQSLLGRLFEFDEGLSSYNGSAQNLKREIRKLFSVLLSKENQIQKQYDEIQHLKASPSATNFSDNRNNEVSSLRKVVSNKDLKITGKEELIHNIRSLNYTLRRNKISRSSPSINSSADITVDLDKKLQDLDETIVIIEGNLSSLLAYLLKNQDKVTQFGGKSRSLVEALAQTHQVIMSYKETISKSAAEENYLKKSMSDENEEVRKQDAKGDHFNVTPLDGQLNDAAKKVEDLLNAVEVFLYDSEQYDLKTISETLQRQILKLVYIGDLIKSSEKDNSIIQNLRGNLERATLELKSVHEEYSNLKAEKEDLEIKNQKVMEELQAKISALQEAASKAQSNYIKQIFNMTNQINFFKTENNISLQSKTKIKHLEICLGKLEKTTQLQNNEMYKLQKELETHIDKIESMKLDEAVLVRSCQKLTKELEALTKKKVNLENLICKIQNELIKTTHEEQDETYKKKLEYKVEELQNELKRKDERDIDINAQLIKKKQTIYMLNAEQEKLENYNDYLEKSLYEKHNELASGDGRKDLLKEKELKIEMLTVRLKQMTKFIAERDEVVSNLEEQLQISTQILLEDTDSEEAKRSNRHRNIQNDPIWGELESYKVRFQQAMQQNRIVRSLISRVINKEDIKSYK